MSPLSFGVHTWKILKLMYLCTFQGSKYVIKNWQSKPQFCIFVYFISKHSLFNSKNQMLIRIFYQVVKSNSILKQIEIDNFWGYPKVYMPHILFRYTWIFELYFPIKYISRASLCFCSYITKCKFSYQLRFLSNCIY